MVIERRKKSEYNPEFVAEILAADAAPSELITGEQMLQEIIKEPTLDVYLDRAPKLGTPINYPEMVGVLRRKREMFVTAEAKRKSGIKDEE